MQEKERLVNSLRDHIEQARRCDARLADMADEIERLIARYESLKAVCESHLAEAVLVAASLKRSDIPEDVMKYIRNKKQN